MPEKQTEPLQRCQLHEQQNCDTCWPKTPTYRRGRAALDVPLGSFVSIRGRQVYHHPDCAQATADWDGADSATLGERIVHTSEQLAESNLSPAGCCTPPLLHRR